MSAKESNHTQESINLPSEQDQQTFEEAMSELELIVDQLETGEVALEKAIQLFQKGMELSKACHEKLQRVEKQVQILVEENGEIVKKEFRLEEEPREY